jgi:hypothetical protein
MAHIHKQIELQNGDIVDPEDFNLDMRELAGEYNGMLDRDNFQEHTFNFRDIQLNTFNRIYTHSHKDFKITNDTTSFQNGIMGFVFDAETDGTLICEWSGELIFPLPPSSSNLASPTAQFASLQMTVNGSVVAEINRVSGGSFRTAVYMVGAVPISPGRVTVLINGRTGVRGHQTAQVVLAESHVESPKNELVLIHRKR